jgi:hypothetical protein
MNLFLLDDGRLRPEWRFFFAVVVVVAMNFVAGTFSAAFGHARPHLEDLIYRPLLAALLLVSFVAMTKLFDQPESSVATYLGLRRSGWLRQSLAGALLGFVLIFLAVAAIGIFFDYRITRIVINPHVLELPLAVVFILLTGAMAEELMFRGYPFQRLVESIGKVGAILVLSALFGAVHLGNPHVSDNRAVQVFAFANTLLVGAVFAIAYLRTRALWFPWGLHFSWNLSMGLIFGLPVSGISDFSVLVHARAHGPAWLLGGAYGFEGGLLGTLLLLLGLAYVLLFVHPPAPEKPARRLDEAATSGIQPCGTP